MIKKEKVLDLLHELGGCHATDEWSMGWDEAIDTAYDAISKMEEEPTTQHTKKLERLEKALDKACGLLEEQLCCPLEVFDEEMKHCDSFNCNKVKPKECWEEWCLKDE